MDVCGGVSDECVDSDVFFRVSSSSDEGTFPSLEADFVSTSIM